MANVINVDQEWQEQAAPPTTPPVGIRKLFPATDHKWYDLDDAGVLDAILRASDIGVTVEGYDSGILRSSDIGVTVEPFDATILKSSDIGVTVEPFDATILKSSDIGVTVSPFPVDLFTDTTRGLLNSSFAGTDGATVSTASGTVHSLGVGDAVRIILFNNSTDLILGGLAPSTPVNGQMLIIKAIGSANVYLINEDGSAVAAQRLANFITQINTPLIGGKGAAIYVYSSTLSRWVMVHHEQGDPLAFSPTWASLSNPQPSIGSGSLNGNYKVIGNQIQFTISMIAAVDTTFGVSVWGFSLPITPVAVVVGSGFGRDISANLFYLMLPVVANVGGTKIAAQTQAAPSLQPTSPFTWASPDQLIIQGICR